MQKITPFLWFNNNAEEAVNLYTSLFKNSKIKNTTQYTKEGAATSGMAEGSVMTIAFELNGQEFTALNGGPVFKFTEAISFAVNCENQEEIDELWAKLSEGGEERPCGWLKDKFGLSWQIVPTEMGKMMSDPDKEKSGRVMRAILTMKKLDINALRQEYNQN